MPHTKHLTFKACFYHQQQPIFVTPLNSKKIKMIKLTLAIGCLAVFGFVAYALILMLKNFFENQKPTTPPVEKQEKQEEPNQTNKTNPQQP